MSIFSSAVVLGVVAACAVSGFILWALNKRSMNMMIFVFTPVAVLFFVLGLPALLRREIIANPALFDLYVEAFLVSMLVVFASNLLLRRYRRYQLKQAMK